MTPAARNDAKDTLLHPRRLISFQHASPWWARWDQEAAVTSEPDSAYEGRRDFVQLPDADKQRMARLYEEVQGRLREMSLIVARNLGMEISERTKVMLRPVDIQAASTHDEPTTSSNGQVEVHCTETSPHHFECGCYDYQAGTCGPC